MLRPDFETIIDGSTYLIGLTQHCDQVLSLFGITIREQSVRSACRFRSTSTTNTMNVILRTLWIIKVDDKLDSVNI